LKSDIRAWRTPPVDAILKKFYNFTIGAFHQFEKHIDSFSNWTRLYVKEHSCAINKLFGSLSSPWTQDQAILVTTAKA